MVTSERLQALQDKASWIWRETLRIHKQAPETRVASSLSCVEIFVTLYYSGLLQQRPAEPLWPGRDRCIISKGHGSMCMYPILADLGYFPQSELQRVCRKGGILGGIPDPVIPGYETVNGSLGHGVGVASGMALGLKRRSMEQQVYVIAGDGELHEGANWEAFMFAAQHQLDNLTVIVDNNRTSMLNHTDKIVSHRSLPDKFSAFGWHVDEVDGHDIAALLESLESLRTLKGKPKAIIAHTHKGHGVPGLEDAPLSHIMTVKPEVIDTLLGEE
jgi:transketolase